MYPCLFAGKLPRVAKTDSPAFESPILDDTPNFATRIHPEKSTMILLEQPR